MNAPQRDEGGRGRRRRRRGSSSNNRNDTDQGPPHSQRQPRKHQSYQSKPYKTVRRDNSSVQSQGQAANERGKRSEVSTTSAAPGPKRGTRDVRVSEDIGTVTESGPESTAEKSMEQKDTVNDNEKIRKEKEREEAERRVRLEAQNAKRSAERDRNLLYNETAQGKSSRKERPSDSELRQLDSSLKKCTGFLRKIRFSGITADSVSTLCNEAQALNLSRYISEVVAAITESKLRSSDIENIIMLCGEMHRRYEDFTSQLVASLGNLIIGSSANGSARDLPTRKAAMRLMVEMFVLGMISDINPVTSVLKQLMKASKESMDGAVQSVSILATFVRCANRTLLPPTSPKSPAESNTADSGEFTAWEVNLLPISAKNNIFGALESFYVSDVERIVKDAVNSLNKAKIAYNRSVQMRDNPEDSRSNAFDAAKQVCEKIISSANVLADSLGKPTFELPADESQGIGSAVEASNGQESTHVIVANPFNSFGRNRQSAQEVDMMMHADHPFEGDQQRIFYTELISAKDILERAREPHPKESTQTEKGDASQSGEQNESHKAHLVSSKREANEDRISPNGKSTPDGRRKVSEKSFSMDKLFNRLTTTESKEDADNFVRQFIVSTDGLRNGAKRLGKALLSVSPQKLNVLPAYSRIAATLQSLYPDMICTTASGLEEEFRFLVSKPDADEKNLLTCTKSATYVGEYVKFGLISSSTMFSLLALCMKDLTGHRVDLACHLLETCGRYVYLSPMTHIRMATILETLWRLKSVKNLEARHNTLIETAFFAVRLSPGSKAHKKKSRPPLHEYIRHLIYYRLDATNIGWTHSQLMKLPWNDELESYVAKKFVKISRARFSTIPYVAALIGSVQKEKPGIVTSVIDSLLESIRTGMEKNDGRESQRRLAEVHLLGELHKCGIVDEKVIYNVLYLFITLGHENGDVNQRKGRTSANEIHVTAVRSGPDNAVVTKNGTFTNAPDPPGDFFRIRLACSLLESCGRVLAVANRRKLEVFWLFMERYMFCKTYQAGQGDSLPLHINHVVGDLFENLMCKQRRVGKDARIHQGPSNDRKAYHSSGKIGEKGYGRIMKRSKNLEEAARAVMLLERSPADLGLIMIPSRRIEGKPEIRHEMNGNGRGSRGLSPSLSSPAPGSGITGNVRDGFVTTNSRKREADSEHSQNESFGDDFNGADSISDDMFSQETNAEDGFYDDIYEGDETPESEEYIDSLEDDSEEDEGSDSDESDEDDMAYRRRPRTEEEDAFAKELAAFTAAAVQSARSSTSRITKFDRMAIPMALMTQKMEEEKAAAAAAAAEAANSANQEYTSEDEDEAGTSSKHRRERQKKSVEFKMLIRKGGKSQLHGLQVPATSSLAVAAKESETADAARSEETKRLVLGSTIVLNDDSDDLDDEVPLRFQQDVRDKEKSIQQQRLDDERELLSTLFRTRPRR